jgi:predicted lipid carrier protein YhbT
MIDALMRKMQGRHPRLFQNLERLDAASICFEPSDVPHRFLLTFGRDGNSFVVMDSKQDACDARIKGKLDTLLNMLEGRIDGDKLFFSRDIEISGNTAAVVALRNTLDREEIDLLDDVASLFGPFKSPVREAVLLADCIARHIRDRRGIMK